MLKVSIRSHLMNNRREDREKQMKMIAEEEKEDNKIGRV